MPTGASVITEALEQAGVEVCFGLPGVHNLPLWSALRTSRIRLVGVRHEQTAVYAADGYARATGRLGAALVTTGPGAANAVAALGEAWASRSPVLLIATDIPTTLRRTGVYRGALHETDGQSDLFGPVTKAVERAESAGDVWRATAAAIGAAVSAPTRPAYLEIPTDLLGADAPSAVTAFWAVGADELPAPDAGTAADALAGARKPLIWAGSGARDAAADVAALAERLAAPVVTTYGGRGIVPARHPCGLAFPPHVEPVGRLWDEADVVVAIGSDLDGMNTQNWRQPRPPTLVVVNVDRDDGAKNYGADAVVEGDAATACRALLAAVPPRDGLDGLAQRLHRVESEACARLDSRALRFLDAVEYALPADAVVLADMCIPGYWIAGFHSFAAPRRLQYPVGWGTLGFAFPASVGAALAGTGPVVSLSGDGGFLFACGELATVRQERLPLTAVVVDDGGYGMLRYDQQAHGEEPYGVDLQTPDFEALARSFGLEAETVTDLEDQFGEALARHVASREPSVLVAVAEALVPPPTTSPNWYRRP